MVPYPGDEAIRELFGKDLKTIMQTLNYPMQKYTMFKETFSKFLSNHPSSKIVPGMIDVLNELKFQKFTMALVTSKSRKLVNDELITLGIREFFSAIVDESSTTVHKPDPAPLLKACELLDVVPSSAIPYVGDSRFDMIAACRAGLFPIGVTWGVHGKDVVANLPQNCPQPPIFDSPMDLLQFLKNLH